MRQVQLQKLNCIPVLHWQQAIILFMWLCMILQPVSGSIMQELNLFLKWTWAI